METSSLSISANALKATRAHTVRSVSTRGLLLGAGTCGEAASVEAEAEESFSERLLVWDQASGPAFSLGTSGQAQCCRGVRECGDQGHGNAIS